MNDSKKFEITVTYIDNEKCYVEGRNIGQTYLIEDLPEFIQALPDLQD